MCVGRGFRRFVINSGKNKLFFGRGFGFFNFLFCMSLKVKEIFRIWKEKCSVCGIGRVFLDS